MRYNRDLVCLNMIEGVGYRKFRVLLDACGSTERILSAPACTLAAVPGIDRITAARIASYDRRSTEREYRLIEENRITVTTVLDDEYPELLRHLYSPPLVLYVRGVLEKGDAASVALVGTRRPSHYGISCATRLGFELA